MSPPRLYLSLFPVLLLVVLASCGSGTITFGGDDDIATITIRGNLDRISPVSSRDIVVFAYRIDDGSDRCPCPPDPSSNTSGRAVVLPTGQMQFTITDLRPGAYGVVFLLDKAGSSADGQIDPGDPIAILDDIDCQLNDVRGKQTVVLEDVDLLFDAAPAAECRQGVVDPPAPGRARASRIRKQIETAG
jgi:hypothetical protein